MLQSPTESLSIEKKAQNFITPCPTCSIANIVQMWLLLFYFPFLFFFSSLECIISTDKSGLILTF